MEGTAGGGLSFGMNDFDSRTRVLRHGSGETTQADADDTSRKVNPGDRLANGHVPAVRVNVFDSVMVCSPSRHVSRDASGTIPTGRWHVLPIR